MGLSVRAVVVEKQIPRCARDDKFFELVLRKANATAKANAKATAKANATATAKANATANATAATAKATATADFLREGQQEK
jgi:hypothetical protein